MINKSVLSGLTNKQIFFMKIVKYKKKKGNSQKTFIRSGKDYKKVYYLLLLGYLEGKNKEKGGGLTIL